MEIYQKVIKENIYYIVYLKISQKFFYIIY